MVSHDLRDEGRDTELVALETLATGERYRFWQMFGAALRGWTRARDGDRDAINTMQMAIGWYRETGQPLLNTKLLTMVARAYLLVGEPALGLDNVIDALDETQRVGAWYLESEIQCLRGEILRSSGAGAADIEGAFQLSLDVARRQGAKALELRAAVELARWWAANGAASKKAEGRRLLRDVYGWFTEGQETPDLMAAKQLLGELS
jgi:hypothetical protein